MTQTLTTWTLRIDRGPDWLLAKATREADGGIAVADSLADMLWAAMERNMTYRLVLELDQRQELGSDLLDELISLDRRARVCGGFVRLCGLAEPAREGLRRRSGNGPCDILPCFQDRRDAVLGCHRPKQPR